MTTPTGLSYDQSPPFRPSVQELGGGAKTQSGRVDPVRLVTADDFNEWQRQLAAFARVLPNAILTVHYVGSAYVIQQVGALSTLVDASAFTIVKNGTGDVTISWPANTFPAAIADHEATLTGSAAGMSPGCDSSTPNAARVRLKSAANAAADLPFNLRIF